jgi:hypothetical protein
MKTSDELLADQNSTMDFDDIVLKYLHNIIDEKRISSIHDSVYHGSWTFKDGSGITFKQDTFYKLDNN